MTLRLDTPSRAAPAAKIVPSAVPGPPSPQTLEDVGVDPELMVDMLVKAVYRFNIQRPSEMADVLRLPLPLVEQLIQNGIDKKLFETVGQLGANLIAEMRYALTMRGREWAVKALAISEWVGAVPVPLPQFRAQARRQSIRRERLTRPKIEKQFSDLILSTKLMDQIGPAVNSGQSILLYGPPGNGKSSIAEAICAGYTEDVYIPRALEVDGQIVAMFDPTVHNARPEPERDPDTLRTDIPYDPRFVRCARPIVITGGELTLDMLDLAYSPVSKVYEAPIQLKAAGGILVVDDFGRQRQAPQDIINRLIVPLENGVDYLSLQTGRKFDVPFDALMVFSTNINPSSLVDDAALRRLRYKIHVESPDLEAFVQIFNRAAWKAGLELTEDILSFVLFELYDTEGRRFQAFHPRFLIEQTMAICAYEDIPPQLTRETLKRAWRNLFTEH